MDRIKELSFGERMGWTGLYAVVAGVLVYIVANFDALVARFGLLPVIAFGVGAAAIISATGGSLVERMRYTAGKKKIDRK